MTTALVLAAQKADPHEYDEGVDILREVFLFLCTMYNVLVKAYQFKKYVWLNSY